jgi:hypothetical protein
MVIFCFSAAAPHAASPIPPPPPCAASGCQPVILVAFSSCQSSLHPQCPSLNVSPQTPHLALSTSLCALPPFSLASSTAPGGGCPGRPSSMCRYRASVPGKLRGHQWHFMDLRLLMFGVQVRIQLPSCRTSKQLPDAPAPCSVVHEENNRGKSHLVPASS